MQVFLRLLTIFLKDVEIWEKYGILCRYFNKFPKIPLAFLFSLCYNIDVKGIFFNNNFVRSLL